MENFTPKFYGKFYMKHIAYFTGNIASDVLDYDVTEAREG